MPFEDFGYSQFSECSCGPGCRRTFEQVQFPIGIELSLELKKRWKIADKLLAQAGSRSGVDRVRAPHACATTLAARQASDRVSLPGESNACLCAMPRPSHRNLDYRPR